MARITETSALVAYCEDLAKQPYMTVDTEFMRERTYWPKLCLVQLAGPESDGVAVDPLAEGLDLSALFALLADPGIVKVFHAARQDLEIFYHLAGRLPAPVFDTQVAAMVCGFGDQVGYETLVTKLARSRLDKASQFTDWSLRPLSERQIDYAISDVTHLRRVYERLCAKLEQNGRAAWLDEEMATLTDPATYDLDPMSAYQRIKTRSTSPRFLAVLREVAAWRDRQAQEKDVPRNRILRDEALCEIAHHHPTTPAALARTRGLGRGLAEGSGGAALLDAVARGLAVPEEDCPSPSARRSLPGRFVPLVELLKVLLKMKCDEHDVAQRLVASSADLEAIALHGGEADVNALHGWRRQVFGQDALNLRTGRVGIAMRRRRLALFEVEPPADSEGADEPAFE